MGKNKESEEKRKDRIEKKILAAVEKRELSGTERNKKQQPFNTLVIDPKEGFGLEYIESPQGRRWFYGNNLVYLMARNDGVLNPIELPKKLPTLPEELYRALSWDKETKVLFDLGTTLLEKFNVIGSVLLIGLLLFFVYLIFSSL